MSSRQSFVSLLGALLLVVAALAPLPESAVAQDEDSTVARLIFGANICPAAAPEGPVLESGDCEALPFDGVTVTATDQNGLTAAQCVIGDGEPIASFATCTLGVAREEAFTVTLDVSAVPAEYTLISRSPIDITSPRLGNGDGIPPYGAFTFYYVPEEQAAQPTVPPTEATTEPVNDELETPAPGSAGTGSSAAIYAGDCDINFADADAVAVLSETTEPQGEQQGSDDASAAETSFTTLDLPLDDILAEDHVLVVFDEDDDTVALACGPIGGIVTEDGTLVFGLPTVGESRFSGVAYLTADGEQTLATIFLAEGLSAEATPT